MDFEETNSGQLTPAEDRTTYGKTSGAMGPKVPRQQRACETCRQLKIRCIFDPKSPTNSCIKCTKLNQSCTIRPYYRKKRTKKADSRVADLERKMEALTASLEAQKKLQSSLAVNGYQQPGFGGIQDTPPSSVEPDNVSVSTGPSTDASHTVRPTRMGALSDYETGIQRIHVPAEEESSTDVIDRGVLDIKTAYEAFHRFHCISSKHAPFVVFAHDVKAEDIRREKPNLFLAILAVAIGLVRPDLEVTLVKENFRNIAQRTIVEGKASLELVQMLLVTCLYVPPSSPNEGRNFTYINHLAATMAMDLDLGRKPYPDPWKESMGDICAVPSVPKADAVESRRTWLGCYYVTSMMGTSLRRQPMLRWNSYNEECLRILETAPDAAPTDIWVCHMVRCQHILEDVQRQFGLDGINPIASFAEPKIAFQIRTFDNQVADWRATATNRMPQDLVDLMGAFTSLYVHEISLVQDSNTDDAPTPPLTAHGLELGVVRKSPSRPTINTTQASSLISCLEAVHKVFDTYLSLRDDTIRTLPIVLFVRVVLSATLLIRFDVVVSSARNFTVFTADDVRAADYLSQLQEKIRSANKGNPNRTASCFLFIISMLAQWHTTTTKKRDVNRAIPDHNISETQSLAQASDDPSASDTYAHEDAEVSTPSSVASLTLNGFGEDFDLMDWGADGSMDWMGMGWMTSGFNFNTGVWTG